MEADDLFWMRHAIALAQRASAQGEVPVGAVAVYDNRVIGEGWNQPITNHDCSAHAEIIALKNAGQTVGNYRLPGITLYVTIEPCAMCAGAMVHSRIGRLVYGAAEPKAGVVESNLDFFNQPFLNHRVSITSGVLSEMCGELLSAFFSARRKCEKKETDFSSLK